MRFFQLVLPIALMIGCAVPERVSYSTFEPAITGRDYQYFEYMAVADASYPAEDALAEQKRIEWLEEWLKANRVDSAEYEIVSRRPVFRRETESGKVYDIFYRIRVPR